MPRLSLRRDRFLAAAPAALLTAEFAIFDLAYYFGEPTGNDARLYLAATQAWVAGGDPWAVVVAGMVFAGPPITLLPILPFVWMPTEAFVALVIASSFAAGVFVLRRIELPYWWLLFPPLMETLLSGSINLWVLALLFTRLEWLGVVAKLYAGVPTLVLGHLHHISIALAVTVLTLPFLPWAMFGAHDQAAVLVAQTNGGRSAWVAPTVLLPAALIAFVLVGRFRSAWFAVPVLWPTTQFAYSIFAMPARMSSLAAALLAFPVPGAPVAALVAEAAVLRWRAARRSSAELATTSYASGSDSAAGPAVETA